MMLLRERMESIGAIFFTVAILAITVGPLAGIALTAAMKLTHRGAH